MNCKKYIKMILYKMSLKHNVCLTTIEKYNNGISKKTIVLIIDKDKKYFSSDYFLLKFLQEYMRE